MIVHRKGGLRRSKGGGFDAVRLGRGKHFPLPNKRPEDNPSWRAEVTATMRELGMSEEEIAAEWAKRSK